MNEFDLLVVANYQKQLQERARKQRLIHQWKKENLPQRMPLLAAVGKRLVQFGERLQRGNQQTVSQRRLRGQA